MATHRNTGDSERTESVTLAPVEQNQRLENKAAAHHKDVGNIVQTRAPVLARKTRLPQ